MSQKKSLSAKAYEVIDGKEYPSFVPPEENLAEFTGKAVVIGALIGGIFGAANAYLGLKVGLTVSASIPAAVMAVAIFRIFFRQGTILETNMVQTVGSAGESLAAGVIFTIPALFIWGMEPKQLDIILIAILGGCIGVLFMIPLRRFLIVREHGKLPYPEGTACAEVLVAGQGDLSKAGTLFAGMGVGAIYQTLMNKRIFGLWSKEPATHIPGFHGAELAAEVTPELLGVGYIIGPKISAIMLSGGMLGWMVLIPLIYVFGADLAEPLYPETAALIRDMAPIEIWSRYIRYIGAGGVAFAGIFSLIKSIPVIWESFRVGISQMGQGEAVDIRTQQDLPMKFIVFGALGLIIAIAIFLITGVFRANVKAGFIAAFLIVFFGFFFVTVSSRVVGLLGSSSNPISGMTIATLLLTCVLFLLAGLGTMPNVKLGVLIVGAFVCIAAAIAGDTSQDLKTGFLVGATPKYQQMGEFIGVIASGLTMGFVMYLLKDAIISGDLPAPQANLMKLVIDGVIGGNLPWNLVYCGMFIAFGIELLGINSLAFAVGLYLPMSLSVPIMAGGFVRWVLERNENDPILEKKREAGVLYSSGLIAGAALTGVLIMVLVGVSDQYPALLEKISQPGIYAEHGSGHRIIVGKEILKKDYSRPQGKKLSDGYVPISPSSKEFLEGKFRTFPITFYHKGKQHKKILKIKKWKHLYLSVDEKKGLIISGSRKNSDARAVIAFLILTMTLCLVVFKTSARIKEEE
ncbi:OPT family oligopeptide transporter [Candidatus Riflebacteria bacterium]